MRIKIIVFVLLIIISGIFYYNLTEPKMQEVYISHVIDGDTIETENGVRIRLLGINTPEKGQFCYEEARRFLQDLVENKSVSIEWKKTDKYGRILGYVFLNGMINKKILENGFANIYYYEKDRYFSQMGEAESSAREKEIGIWKKSQNYWCLVLEELKFNEPERLVLTNKCDEMEVVIKDEATHIFNATLHSGKWEKNFSHIWNDEGDSLFVYDCDGLLLFHRY